MYYEISLDITTDVEMYKLAAVIYIKDEFDGTKVGIECLFLLKASEDPNREFAYHGDGKTSIGANIGKIWVDPYEE